MENPYRQYILPLAYEHVAPLYAILGLSACHQGIQRNDKEMHDNEAVHYQLKAIRALAALLNKDRNSMLSEVEQDALLATIQILILHDVSLSPRTHCHLGHGSQSPTRPHFHPSY